MVKTMENQLLLSVQSLNILSSTYESGEGNV